MADPSVIGRQGHRYQLILKNDSTGEEENIDRVQNVEFGLTATTEKIYELGRVAPVGSAQDPVDFRVTFENNLHDELEAEFIIAGKDVDVDTSYDMDDVISQTDLIAYLLMRNTSGTVDGEIKYTDMVTAEIQWRFAVGGVCTTSITMEGSGGSWLAQGSTDHASWQTLDNTSIGGAKGKDARIWFGSGGSTPDADARAYRLQSFNIRATFPVQTVRELGRRQIVGKLLDPVDITVDFDVLAADEQPHDAFFTAMGGGTGYDFVNPTTQHAFIRLYDPDQTEASSVLRAWKIENLRPTAVTPSRAQVRGLATYRYTLTAEKEETSDTGGLVAYKGDIA